MSVDLNLLKELRDRVAKNWLPTWKSMDNPDQGCIYFQCHKATEALHPELTEIKCVWQREKSDVYKIYTELHSAVLKESGLQDCGALQSWNDRVATKQDVLALVDRVIAHVPAEPPKPSTVKDDVSSSLTVGAI